MDSASTTPLSEECLLVERAKRGDRDSFEILVQRYQRRVFAVALGVLRNLEDARDACQDAFLKAYRNLAGFHGESQFYTWLYRIVWNGCLDQLRRQRRREVAFDETMAADEAEDGAGIAARPLGFDPGAALANKELRREIGDALSTLSTAHRTALLLREVEGLSYAEIAEAMECSVGTVMSRLFYARKKMQARLTTVHEPARLAA